MVGSRTRLDCHLNLKHPQVQKYYIMIGLYYSIDYKLVTRQDSLSLQHVVLGRGGKNLELKKPIIITILIIIKIL